MDLLADRSFAQQEFEESHPLGSKAAGAEEGGGGAVRREAVGRLVALGRALGLHEECIHDSVQLLDRLCRMGLHSESLAPSVLGAIALISAKQGTRPRTAWTIASFVCRPCYDAHHLQLSRDVSAAVLSTFDIAWRYMATTL